MRPTAEMYITEENNEDETKTNVRKSEVDNDEIGRGISNVRNMRVKRNVELRGEGGKERGERRNEKLGLPTGVYRMRENGGDKNNEKGRNEIKPKRGEKNEEKLKGEEEGVKSGGEKKAEGGGDEKKEGRRTTGTERGRERGHTRHVREIKEWFEMRIRDETESPVWERGGEGSPPPQQHHPRPKR